QAAARKALELDNTLGEAHAVLAEWIGDWSEAEKEFKRAIELSPNYPTAHQWYAEWLVFRGRFDDARQEINRAQELDPLSLVISSTVGFVLYYTREYDQAIEQCKKTLEMEPNYELALYWLMRAFEAKGMYAEAIETRKKFPLFAGERGKWLAALREAYMQAG